MEKIPSWLHFPIDMKLESSPLLEAWFEFRWQLQPGDIPQLQTDPDFPYALGVFYKSIQDTFQHREKLDISEAPPDFFPHRVRYRFREKEDTWPLLQLGPGVATVNFTEPYTWDLFKEKVLYLRSKLLYAYGEDVLKTQSVALRYRNGVALEYSSSNLLAFFEHNLNTSIGLPNHVPGPASSQSWPIGANINLTFELLEPRGVGALVFRTAHRTQKETESDPKAREEMLLWQLEVISQSDDAPALGKEEEFTLWLASAHAVIHDWFFSLIKGPLLDRYVGKVDSNV
jgi:uncharacterized protein (TIGR04255 family)